MKNEEKKGQVGGIGYIEFGKSGVMTSPVPDKSSDIEIAIVIAVTRFLLESKKGNKAVKELT